MSGRSGLGSGGEAEGAWSTAVRGLRLSPELRVGAGLTLALAVLATAGRVLVPVALQLVVDRALLGTGRMGRVLLEGAALAAVAVAVTGVAGYLMNLRLARTAEEALARLRSRAFRHLHDLSQLTLAAERRGSLVARVTADVDVISQFMSWGGPLLIVSCLQLVLATAVMALYSWQLTLLVLAAFVPLALALRRFQRVLVRAYDRVRWRVGDMLAGLAESVVAAEVVRAYGVEERTRERAHTSVDRHADAAFRAARLGAFMFASGEVVAALATAGVVVVGVLLGIDGQITAGRLLAFLFLVTLFVGPVQLATEVLDQAQTAVSGWRRVLDVLDEVPDVADPAAVPGGHAVDLPPGPLELRFDGVRFRYPAREGESAHLEAAAPALALDGIDLVVRPRTRVAVVGETGSGKTTFARLLTRLADPTEGRVLLGGADLRDVSFSSLRRRALLVPQEGFLFDTTIEQNVRLGRPSASRDEVAGAVASLGLGEWLDGLPAGLDTPVGERGEQLSAGERQLIALARARLADPDLLVLDEATSAVDPATEARLVRALERLAAGRTAVTIAHRLSSAEAADEIVVFDRGRVVQRGAHAELVGVPGVYARLHRSWSAGVGRDVGRVGSDSRASRI